MFSLYKNTQRRSVQRLLLITASAVLLQACASSHYGSARLVSVPEGAEVINIDDGTVIGVTPTTAWWKDSGNKRKHVALRYRKGGYYEKVSSFWLSMRHKTLEEARNNPQVVEVSLTPK